MSRTAWFLLLGLGGLVAWTIYRNRIKSPATAAREEQANGVPANGLAALRRSPAVTQLAASLSPSTRNTIVGASKTLPFLKSRLA